MIGFQIFWRKILQIVDGVQILFVFQVLLVFTKKADKKFDLIRRKKLHGLSLLLLVVRAV
jgi:hypothetical protein